jgi:hypothetical protein
MDAPLQINFQDKTVTYDTFVNDVVARLLKALRDTHDDPEYVSQSQAYRMFGRRNVDRWRRAGLVDPVKRPGKMAYQTSQLRQLQQTKQDYLYR